VREQGAFSDHLGAGLEALRVEMPVAHARMVRAIGPRTAELTIDEERVLVRFGNIDAKPDVRVVCSAETILALADGDQTLEEAIASDRLTIFGGVDDLIAFHDALQFFLHGAVRSPTFPRRLERFRADAHRRAP
jgi:hypothetical protein